VSAVISRVVSDHSFYFSGLPYQNLNFSAPFSLPDVLFVLYRMVEAGAC